MGMRAGAATAELEEAMATRDVLLEEIGSEYHERWLEAYA